MNNNYRWKGVTFNSKGIIIEKVPIVPRAQHSYTTYEIPGRSGFLTIDNKTYEGIPFSLECHFKEGANINEIRAFLDGYGSLQLDNEKIYKGYISNQIDWEKVCNFRKFIIQFMLQPIATSVISNGFYVPSSPYTWSDTTMTNTYPSITVVGSGDVTIQLNDKSFTIYDMESGKSYVLDCGAKVITKNGVNVSGSMSGEFPYIKPGSNTITITGTTTSVFIDRVQTFL